MSISKYVQIRPVVMEDFPDAHNVFLVVGNQSFCVTPYAMETKTSAEMMAEMLRLALQCIVDEPRGGGTP